MKHLTSVHGLLAALCLAAPATGLSKDHHKHHDDRCDSRSRSYCPPVAVYRSSYPYAYGYRPSPYYYPTYSSSYYYSRPTVGISFTTSPSYTTYRGISRSDDYADDLAVDVQRSLRKCGYYRGDVDGDIGPGTRSAIREYQYDHRLEVTGRIDRSLLRSLGLS
jgi:hypothetical protein